MDAHGATPLFHAALGGHDNVMQLLLANGARRDEVGHAPTGANALHAAAAGGWLAPIRALLQHVGAAEQGEAAAEGGGGGYDEDEEEEDEEDEDKYIDNTDKEGHTALWHAAANGHAPAIRFLLRWGADPLLLDAAGELPRQAAAAAGFADCVAMLEVGVGVHVVGNVLCGGCLGKPPFINQSGPAL